MGFVNFMVKLLLAFAFNHLLFLLFNPRNRRNPRINSFWLRLDRSKLSVAKSFAFAVVFTPYD